MSVADANQQLQSLLDYPQRAVPSLQVAVVRSGEVVYAQSFGHRYVDPDVPSKNLPVDNQTRFRAASISKLVVGLGVMKLVEQRKVDLEADISEYLGFTLRNPAFPKTSIQVKTLLGHTSSIRDGSCYSVPSPFTLLDFFNPQGRFLRPGPTSTRPTRPAATPAMPTSIPACWAPCWSACRASALTYSWRTRCCARWGWGAGSM